MNKALVPLLGLLVLALPPALAQVDIHQEPAHFQHGRNSASLQGKIKSDPMADYPWRAAAGQTMEVTPKASAGTDNWRGGADGREFPDALSHGG